ncbi:hypothetical protein JD844_013899 [Phrynosoma platyrhinos]|uniref:Antigen peptide transporter 2 n=1 Tax=Phrynosoma platyrhinos TaxID=52577 RepID=A0ABQ7TM79_PHRPL|nr:hypothetical protein JD844_013899 [Phrynosoma platyrhinos]
MGSSGYLVKFPRELWHQEDEGQGHSDKQGQWHREPQHHAIEEETPHQVPQDQIQVYVEGFTHGVCVGYRMGSEVPCVEGKRESCKGRGKNLSREVQESLAKANEVAMENLQSISTVRSFANEDGASRCYEDRLQETYQLSKWEVVACAASMGTSNVRSGCSGRDVPLPHKMEEDGVMLFGILGEGFEVQLSSPQLSGLALKIGILYYGGHLVTLGLMSGSDLVTFVLYEKGFSTAIRAILQIYPRVQKAIGSSEKVFEYIDRMPKISPSGVLAPKDLQGHMVLKDVSFSYPDRDSSLVLKGVSLELHPGTVTALVGPSGSGKSTIVALLERFYEPQKGQVALVSQAPVLLARSLHKNIAYGLGERSQEEVAQAAQRVGAHRFVVRLNHGYDTDAGETGGQISGGQRQAIAITRALIRDPRVLILDDATSALDTESQQEMVMVVVVVVVGYLQTGTSSFGHVVTGRFSKSRKFNVHLQLKEDASTVANMCPAVAMLPRVFLQAAALLLCDVLFLSLLGTGWPSLALLGVPAAWLEAALRLLALWGAWGLLSLGWPSRIPPALLATVSLLPPFYLAVGHKVGDPPLLLSSAPWSWLLVGYGAVGLALLIWGVLSPGGATEDGREGNKATLWKLVKLFRPDAPYIAGAFFFLAMAVVGETFIPYYTGRLIDILGTKYDSDAFSWAILLVCLISFGRPSILLIPDPQISGDSVSSIETVRSFATEEEESQRYDTALKETHRLKNQRDLERAIYVLLQRFLHLGLKLMLLYCGYHQILAGLVTKGDLVSFTLYQMEVGEYTRTLMRIYGDALSNVGAAKKVFEYLHREPSVRTEGTLAPGVLQGHVLFRNVSFSYPSRPDVQVLKNVSFELQPGEVTALVGLNGSGKTTCVALLERFYEPQSGEILLDGNPIREYEHKYLHRQVALVGQEPILFSGSIRDNIAYGMEDCSNEQVTAAAEEANALGFITELEGGFSADVGEKGGQLSVGQRQRLAIARALIRNPKVLILDEATSALDVESEAAIQQSVLSRQARAVLVIAHRMQTVENAHKIVVLEGGKVVEEGTHSELMDQKGPYYRLVQRSSME